MTKADLYKNSLLSIILKMKKAPWLFACDGAAFSRTKKLSYETTICMILSMQGGTIGRALALRGIDATASAFVQRRDQILKDAFAYLFYEFTQTLPAPERYKGFRLLALDGSSIPVPANPGSPSYHTSGRKKDGSLAKGYNLVHLNAVYDLQNKLYADAVITPLPTEVEAAHNMIRRYSGEKAILIADRGYSGYNILETINRNPSLEYVFRTANSNTFAAVAKLPLCELDTDREVHIVTSAKNHVPGQTVLLSGPSPSGRKKKNVNWHYEPDFQLALRIVRFRISDDSDSANAYETIVTSLPREEFPLEEIKKIYHMRWGIETSFRELKYNVGVIHFHSRKDNAVYQSIWAALIMYNFSMAVAALAVVRQKPERKYIYAISIADAIAACLAFFTQINIHAPPDGKALIEQIEKHLCPIRPGRTDERKPCAKGSVHFMYRVTA